MINRLLQKAQSSIEIGGTSYPLITRWSACLRTYLAIKDIDIEQDKKIEIILHNSFVSLPYETYDTSAEAIEFFTEAVKGAIKFLSYDFSDDEDRELQRNLIDFNLDGVLIKQAFLKKGIELDNEDDLHWWIFLEHFSELPESQLSRIMYLRSQFQKKKLTKEEKEECSRYGWHMIEIIDSEDAQLLKAFDEQFKTGST